MQQFALEATYPLLRSATVRTPISTAFPLLFALATLATLAVTLAVAVAVAVTAVITNSIQFILFLYRFPI